MYYPVETRITPLARVRRERLLPARGEVFVTIGQSVEPSDVIAHCRLTGETHFVDVSRALGMRRERTATCLLKEIGDMVLAGERIAAPRGLPRVFRRDCRSPVNGQVIDARNGMLVIEAKSTTFELRAHFRGQVIQVMPARGVAISTSGTLIQGVWGSGGEAEGNLKVLVDRPDQRLGAGQIGPDRPDCVVVAGRIVDGDDLEEASRAKVSGMIVGSVDAILRQRFLSLPYPILVTEGFGELPMSHMVFTLLQSNTGREAMLNAGSPARHSPGRPEVLIPLNQEEDPSPNEPGPVHLQVGMQVRGLRAPYSGAIGTVMDLPSLPQIVESGSRVPVAEVELLDDGKLVRIPQVNLEWVH